MEPFAELLKLYSAHSTQQIEADGARLLAHFNVSDPDALLAIVGYKEAFSLVSTCARLVDDLVAHNPEPEGQMREGVRLLRRMVDDGEPPKKLEGTRALIEGRLLRSWPEATCTMYHKKKTILDWRDFFVSYTNRDAPATNGQFRSLIRTCLGLTPKGDENKSNYVARVINRHLRRYQNLSGFFDDDNLKVGEDLTHAVDQFCTRAFALVQFIEPLALTPDPAPNWVFYEYQKFSDNPAVLAFAEAKDRHFFILAESEIGDLRPANLPHEYEPWVQRIGGIRHISLKNERNTTLRAKIKTIATEILHVRAAVIEAWLKAS